MDMVEQIELTITDEMARKLLEEARFYFYHGQFGKALDTAVRCVRAPKSKQYAELDVRVYNLLAMIYGFLNQENLSKEYISKALHLEEIYGTKEYIFYSYMNLGFLHQKLGDLEASKEYMETALSIAEEILDKEDRHYLLCQACHAIVLCKLGCMDMDLQKYEKVEGFSVSILDLYIRYYYQKNEPDKVKEYCKRLICEELSPEEFIAAMEYYIDVCDFLLEKDLKDELHSLLCFMERYIEVLPLSYLSYKVRNFELLYARKYGTKEELQLAIKNWMEVLPEFEKEQQHAKKYNFEYIEFLHEEKNLSEMMEERSKLDPMTGLLNKYMLEFLSEEYMKRKDSEEVAAVLMVDIDHFKQINDTLGHLAGDTILADTAAVIKRFFKEDILCGRIGGDEFVIVVKDVKDISTLCIQAELLRQEIAKVTSERRQAVMIRASMGIALSSAGYTDYKSLYLAADKALRNAKRNGRNKVEVIE